MDFSTRAIFPLNFAILSTITLIFYLLDKQHDDDNLGLRHSLPVPRSPAAVAREGNDASKSVWDQRQKTIGARRPARDDLVAILSAIAPLSQALLRSALSKQIA